jgi:acyl carrier protein
MDTREIFVKVIAPGIERANNEMPGFDLPGLDETTPLYGVKGAILDSLNLISFVFIIEEEFKRVTGKTLKITTQDVLNSDSPPFANLFSLSKFLKEKLQGI